ncbi:polysaccharide biosynthesis/export family protein [Alienimonas chondri]|uniref:Polysaccharide export protein N-terminal domain-containing protein n=1 Tax=Alienimonas chondri TaxID=2681879 RepID=A0ABX1VBC9_9PLAN|nr:polysaccharide biosynthesis/export family protein [Alienimonas chondri]NNJ24653.1 hypothetical protein [Alienimonas chondri]
MVPLSRPRPPARLRAAANLVLLAVISAAPGCAAFRSLEGVPADSLSAAFRDPVRSGRETIDLSLLGRTPPPQHRVDSGDVLGVYIEGVLGGPEQAPPIYNPAFAVERPGVGFPIAVREDGTLALPTAGAVSVRGLTLPQVEAKLREEFTVRNPILKAGQDRVLVSLQRPRTHSVLVIRQESGNQQGNIGAAATVNFELDKRGTGRIVELPAYQNDVLHALAATGGLPGLDAQNVIYVIRRPRNQATPVSHGPVEGSLDGADRDGAGGATSRDLEEASHGADYRYGAAFAPRRLEESGMSPTVRGQSPPAGPWRAEAPHGLSTADVRSVEMRPAGYAQRTVYSLPPGFELADAPPAVAPGLPVLPAPAPLPLGGYAPADQYRADDQFAAGPEFPGPSFPGTPFPGTSFAEPTCPDPAYADRSFSDAVHASGPGMPDRLPAERWDGADCPIPLGLAKSTMGGVQVLRIPVRVPPGSQVPFTERDVTLYDGDIVFVEHRETDFFYTGGLLGGGQYSLPQNYDIDVLEALAIVRQRGGAAQNAPLAVGGPSSLNQDVTVGGSRLFILRRAPGHPEMRIEVDLRQALRDPSSRVLIRPGDYLILRYTKCEAVGAFFERLLLESALNGIGNSLLIRGSN